MSKRGDGSTFAKIGCHDNVMAVYDDGGLSLALHFSRLHFQVKRGRRQLNWKDHQCFPSTTWILHSCNLSLFRGDYFVCSLYFFTLYYRVVRFSDRTAIFGQMFRVFSVFLLQTFKRLASHWDGNQATEFNGSQRVLLHCSRRFYSSCFFCFFFLPHLSNLPFSLHAVWLPSYLPLLTTLFLKSGILLYNLWGNCKQTGLQLKLIWKLKLDMVRNVFHAFH